MRFVVTGCGRSGTQYVARLLTAAGIYCGHESTFNAWPGDQPPLRWRDSPMVGDSSYVAAPWVGALSRELLVVHLLRAPLDQIRSSVGVGHVHGHGKPWVEFIGRQVDLTPYRQPAVRAAAYWLRWNQLVEPHAHVTWRLHEISGDHVRDLAARIGIEVERSQVDKALDSTSPRTGHAERDESVMLESLGPLRSQAVEQAAHYRLPLEM